MFCLLGCHIEIEVLLTELKVITDLFVIKYIYVCMCIYDMASSVKSHTNRHGI